MPAAMRMIASEMFPNSLVLVVVLWLGPGIECDKTENATFTITTLSEEDSDSLPETIASGDSLVASKTETPRVKNDSLDSTTVNPTTEITIKTSTIDTHINETENETVQKSVESSTEPTSSNDLTISTSGTTTASSTRTSTTKTTSKTTFTTAVTTSTSTTSTTKTSSSSSSSTSTTTITTTTVSCSNCTTVPEDTNIFKSFNLNYLYFLLLSIPVVGVALGVCFWCKRKHKNAYMEPARSSKSRRFSTPSWVFSEPEFADEEVITLHEEKQQ